MTGSDAGLDANDIKRVLDALDRSDWDEALITVGDVSIAVARNGGTLPSSSRAAAAPAPAAIVTAAPVAAPAAPETPEAPAAPAPTAPVSGGRIITAPSVGVFWRAPEPGAAPFVEVGQHVSAGDTLCIVEVMKLMSHVDAPVGGTIVEVHVDNAISVEHGAPLFTLVPDEG
ncbi:MAG: acetyl-CoA carboxylase, biotin carboxyl carrier protein [Humibacillus sp.]|nr:acetyl-CoA carboxylase, biotin carboxyl carrier protein [Humibacillus sp.]